MAEYKSVRIEKGSGGWGGPLVVTPSDERPYVISMTGGGIHPLAKRIAELSGGTAVDAFNNPTPKEQTFCAVVDCGGTLRTGLYPKMGIPTVNILTGGPSGPMAQYCKEDIFVSGVKEDTITLADAEEAAAAAQAAREKATDDGAQESLPPEDEEEPKGGFVHVLTVVMEKVGRAIGYVVNTFFQSARDTVEMMIRNVVPFLIFLALMIGVLTSTGLGNAIANGLQVMTGNIIGLIVMAIIIGIPVLSPLLGPGAAIQQVLGALIGTQIAMGNVPVSLALPALFAISIVDACDFIPVAVSLGEAKPDTARLAVPAMLFSRFITAPFVVLIAWVVSMIFLNF